MSLIRLGTRRDLRVDFFRGLALWWIYIDHIPGNLMANYTLHDVAVCDAAEVFVLLAGYGAGLAYGGTLNRHGYLYAAADTVKRAWTLYIAHIFLFVIFTAQVAYSATLLDRSYYLDEVRLDVLGNAPYRAMLEALLLRFQPSLLNILPLYVVLLLFFAATLWALRRPWLLLLGSFALYLLARLTGLNIPSWTGQDWYFNPFAWQFLFMIGAVLAYAPPRMPRIRWPLDLLTVLVLLTGFLVIWMVNAHPPFVTSVPQSVIRFIIAQDKTGLHPARLMSVMSLLWLVVRLIPMHAAWLRSHAAGLLVLPGQNSLPVFCSGIFFGFIARLGLEYSEDWPMQIAVNVFGALAMLLVALVTAWYRDKGRAAAPRAPAALPAAVRTDTN